MNPGDLASTLVVFLEDRHGKALVGLPYGSKSSLPHECLDLVEAGRICPVTSLATISLQGRFASGTDGPIASIVIRCSAPWRRPWHIWRQLSTPARRKKPHQMRRPDGSNTRHTFLTVSIQRIGIDSPDFFRDAAMKEPEGTWRNALLEVHDEFGLNEDEG
ncbi:hypothetical protein [Streptomyces chartreusis]